MLKNSATQTIGNTPLLRMTRLKNSLGLKSDIFAKLEFLNPAGSIKDRVAEEIIASAIREGKINAKTTVIEATSGNTGIGLAFCCACRGLKLIVVMPDTMSGERISLMKAYGADVVLSRGKLGMRGAVEEAERLAASSDNAFLARQFENPANAAAHFKTTGPEIYRDLSNTDYFVAGIGTGGTITGAGGFLKKKLKDVRLVGVEPARLSRADRGQKRKPSNSRYRRRLCPAFAQKRIALRHSHGERRRCDLFCKAGCLDGRVLRRYFCGSECLRLRQACAKGTRKKYSHRFA